MTPAAPRYSPFRGTFSRTCSSGPGQFRYSKIIYYKFFNKNTNLQNSSFFRQYYRATSRPFPWTSASAVLTSTWRSSTSWGSNLPRRCCTTGWPRNLMEPVQMLSWSAKMWANFAGDSRRWWPPPTTGKPPPPLLPLLLNSLPAIPHWCDLRFHPHLHLQSYPPFPPSPQPRHKSANLEIKQPQRSFPELPPRWAICRCRRTPLLTIHTPLLLPPPPLLFPIPVLEHCTTAKSSTLLPPLPPFSLLSKY